MNKFLKENKLLIAIPLFILFCGLYATWYLGSQTYTNVSESFQKKEDLQQKEDKLERIKKEKLRGTNEKKASRNGKVIYEVLGQQFTPEASFGIMFENVLANITNSGIRIRTIEYNYKPLDDKVLSANSPGYNACELLFTAVGSYSQLQNFFKSVAKENYLSNLYEVYIEPYDKNQNILIAKFKIRLYTKTI